MVRIRYAAHKLNDVLLKVYREGRVTKSDLKRMFGSTRQCNNWLNKLLLKDKLLEKIKKGDRKEGTYFRLGDSGYLLLRALSDRNCFDALCMVRGKMLAECKWVVDKKTMILPLGNADKRLLKRPTYLQPFH